MAEFQPNTVTTELEPHKSKQNELLELCKSDYQEIEKQYANGEITDQERADLYEGVFWEVMLEYNSTKVNEGTEAIILQIDSESVKQSLQELGYALTDEQAKMLEQDDSFVAKMYKIFKSGSAGHEMAMHNRAHEIISQSGLGDQIRVPRLLSDKTKQTLKHPDHFRSRVGSDRRAISSDNEIEYIAMETVDGLDLMTFACQEVILEALKERYPEADNQQAKSIIGEVLLHKIKDHKLDAADPAVRSRCNSIISSVYRASGHVANNFLTTWDSILPEAREFVMNNAPDKLEPELSLLRDLNNGVEVSPAQYVEQITKYELLGSLVSLLYTDRIVGADDDKRAVEMRQLFADVLGYKGILNPVLYEKLDQALKELHRNGFYHRDLHERNIMVSRDRQSLYLIDFGKSKMDGTADDNRSNYETSEGQFFYDHGIVSPARADDPGSILYALTRTSTDRRLDIV